MTTKAYRLSTRKYCPTCGGKAQDPQIMRGEPLVYAEDDEHGETVWDVLGDGTEVTTEPEWEPCDEPYHDPEDEDYVED